MTKRDAAFAGCVFLCALVIWLFYQFVLPGDRNLIRITVDGELFGVYFLEQDQVISIGEHNECRIEDGSVKMIHADCPDQLCVHQKAVDKNGGTIICLPNRVVIEAVNGDGDGTDPEPDAVA